MMQPKLVIGDLPNCLVISKSEKVDLHLQPIKRKRGPRPRDNVKFKQLNLSMVVSTQRKVIRAGRRVVALNQ